jgi:Holliday junction resolvase
MGRMSKSKGKRGELEFASELRRLFGINAQRGVQYCGGSGSPDVISDFSEVHFEIKRAERLSLYPALRQAIKDAGENIPVVCHRANHQDWVVIVRLDDLPKLATIMNR